MGARTEIEPTSNGSTSSPTNIFSGQNVHACFRFSGPVHSSSRFSGPDFPVLALASPLRPHSNLGGCHLIGGCHLTPRLRRRRSPSGATRRARTARPARARPSRSRRRAKVSSSLPSRCVRALACSHVAGTFLSWNSYHLTTAICTSVRRCFRRDSSALLGRGRWAIGRNPHEYMETQTCGRRRSGDSGAEAKRGMSAYLCAYRGALA